MSPESGASFPKQARLQRDGFIGHEQLWPVLLHTVHKILSRNAPAFITNAKTDSEPTTRIGRIAPSLDTPDRILDPM